MIGVDAAELSFIRSSTSALPTFRRLLGAGRVRRLRSTADLLTGSVWPTFYTGTLPGQHGVYHHLQWDARAMRLRRVAADWLYCEPFWHELERSGRRVIAVDVPMTFPSRFARGIEVINWGSHDQLGPFTVHPRNLQREICRRFGSHPMGAEIPVNKSRAELERIRTNLVAGAARKGELSRWLASTQEWDFLITVFGECHRGGHILWPERANGRTTASPGALLDVYQAVDRAVGEILDALPLENTRVVIFSLHGMGPNTSQEHFLPKILEAVNRRCEEWEDAPARRRPVNGGGIMRVLRENLPASLQNTIARAVPVRVRDLVVDRSVTAGHDWSRTPALALLADLNGYVRLNLCGRELRGMLDPHGELFPRYVNWLCECLRGARMAGSDQSLVREVRLASTDFPGERSQYLPDLIVTWTDAEPASCVESPQLGTFWADLSTGRAGNHRSDGFCIVLDRGTTQPGEEPADHIVNLHRLACQSWLR